MISKLQRKIGKGWWGVAALALILIAAMLIPLSLASRPPYVRVDTSIAGASAWMLDLDKQNRSASNLAQGMVHMIPSLPAPPNWTYELIFDRPVGWVLPADLDGDGNLDFVSRGWVKYPWDDSAAVYPETVWIEARTYAGMKLWDFDTNASIMFSPQVLENTRDLPVIAWDFDDDGRWEVYYQYYDEKHQRWRHRIVDGLSGNPLVDAEFPDNWTESKMMVAIAYRDNMPRLVLNRDVHWYDGSKVRVWMFEAWTGSQWSLDVMWDHNDYEYLRNRGGVAHDMIRTVDVDNNGSDDELLLGCIVLNADGSLRYDIADVTDNGMCQNSDIALVGFFSSDHPDELVYVTGDVHHHVTAVWARTGQPLWSHNMSDYFSVWDHWHTGYVADIDASIPGAEALVHDRGSGNWAYLRVNDGHIMHLGQISQGDYSYVYLCDGATVLWNNDDHYECVNESQFPGMDLIGIRADIGGYGCEEIFGLSPDRLTLRVYFNAACSRASMWQDRHYRQDVALIGSGYASDWGGALCLNRASDTPVEDLNQDGQIDILDLQLAINVILGVEKDSSIIARADVNRDGQVNRADVLQIGNRILSRK